MVVRTAGAPALRLHAPLCVHAFSSPPTPWGVKWWTLALALALAPAWPPRSPPVGLSGRRLAGLRGVFLSLFIALHAPPTCAPHAPRTCARGNSPRFCSASSPPARRLGMVRSYGSVDERRAHHARGRPCSSQGASLEGPAFSLRVAQPRPGHAPQARGGPGPGQGS